MIMKKAISLLVLFSIIIAGSASAFDIRGALKTLGSGSGDGNSAADAVGSLLGNVLSSGNISVTDIQGIWTYSAPAVTFKSDNFLEQAGGAAASSAIVAKLSPIYSKVGIDKMTLEIGADSTFVMKVRGITLKGTVSSVTPGSDSLANFVFNFQAGKLKIGKIDTYVVKNPLGSIKVMFDVSKLIQIVKAVSSVTGNSTITTLSKALESYDGVCAGFELKK